MIEEYTINDFLPDAPPEHWELLEATDRVARYRYEDSVCLTIKLRLRDVEFSYQLDKPENYKKIHREVEKSFIVAGIQKKMFPKKEWFTIYDNLKHNVFTFLPIPTRILRRRRKQG